MQGSYKGVLACLLAMTLLLGACGQRSAAPSAADDAGGDTAAAGDSGPASSARCGDASQLSSSVSFYNWGDYIDPDVLTSFEEECGVDVIYDTYSSNEDLLAKLQGGASGYDVIVPSDYMVAIMIQLGLLKELDHANIPNMAHINGNFLD